MTLKNHDNTVNYSGKMSIEVMMAKLLKGVEYIDSGVNEIKSNLSTMIRLADAYFTLIKHLEHQMNQLSAAFNQ